MNLIRKISPVFAGMMIFGMFYSCAGSPEETETVQKETGIEVTEKKETVKEATYESRMVDIYKVSKESYFLDDGSENGYKEYAYDERGFLIDIANYRGSGELLFEEKFTLNEKGQTVRSELYDSEGLTSYTVYAYDDENQLVSEEYYNHRDVFLSGSRYDYDNRGRRILWESFDDKKTLVLKSEYIYKGDDLTKIVFMTPLNEDDGSYDYTYEQGKLMKEVSINGSGKEERRTEYEYSGDQIAKEKIFQLGRLSRVNELNYDGSGNMVNMVTYNRSQKLLGHTEYEYIMFQNEESVLVN